ncbi:MAG: hypothetical protein AMJ62_12145 [Myxococcales bacterium SG8_38]|nr:MAG: hypothetical protein AMJ62_12145 [Myxococcales bacterium SG8_38]
MGRLWLAIALGGLVSPPALASAHSISAALLRLDVRPDGTVHVLLKVPRVEPGPRNLRVRLPSVCRDLGDHASRRTPDAVIESWRVACTLDQLRGAEVSVDGLGPVVGELFLHIDGGGEGPWTAVLSRDASQVALLLSKDSTAERPRHATDGFFVLGIEHILSGPDHLLFVFALLLVVTRVKRNEAWRAIASIMAWTVTAFTVAHSLTLAGSVLGLVRLPSKPVEISIALSVLLLAVELTRDGAEHSLTARYPWAVAFLFGLLHGFGFAGVLREVGLPEEAIGSALFLFNLGVEAGQLLFLAAVASAWWLVRSARPLLHAHWPELRRDFEWAAAYAIGVAAVFWCLQRMWSS